MTDETEVATAPTNMFDITKFTLEGLAMMCIFVPNYTGKPEAQLNAIARKELERRGALMTVGDHQDLWYLPEDVKEELEEVFVVNHMLESFHDIMTPDPDGDGDEEDSEAS